MLNIKIWYLVFALVLSIRCNSVTDKAETDYPDPKKNPQSPLMLTGDWVPANTHSIDFEHLPHLRSQHAMVSDVRDPEVRLEDPSGVNNKSGGVNQHNYLTYFDHKYWIMWSDGPGVEDRVGQRVKYATSIDGIQWTAPQFMTPAPLNSGPDSPTYNTRSEDGWRWISRGFWERNGQLYALVSLDEAAEFFGPGLSLHAFTPDQDGVWKDEGIIYDDAINNFPPKKIPSGDWMMSRRTHDYKEKGVEFMLGGTESVYQWESFPVLGTASELSAEEPFWWVLPDSNLMAIFRDNNKSGYLYRSFSTFNARTWSKPVKTNFPDATSKMNGLRLSDGRYIFVSNANPSKRDPLVLSVSEDGMVFNKMYYLVGGERVDYPHVLEHDGSLLVAFSRQKQTVEVLKISISEIK